MKQMFNFTPSMTHPFLRYAENARLSNSKVQQLIDELRKGLTEEDQIQRQAPTYKLFSQRQKNVMTCYCIMLYIQFLADVSDQGELYARFINDWNNNNS